MHIASRDVHAAKPRCSEPNKTRCPASPGTAGLCGCPCPSQRHTWCCTPQHLSKGKVTASTDHGSPPPPHPHKELYRPMQLRHTSRHARRNVLRLSHSNSTTHKLARICICLLRKETKQTTAHRTPQKDKTGNETVLCLLGPRATRETVGLCGFFTAALGLQPRKALAHVDGLQS